MQKHAIQKILDHARYAFDPSRVKAYVFKRACVVVQMIMVEKYMSVAIYHDDNFTNASKKPCQRKIFSLAQYMSG